MPVFKKTMQNVFHSTEAEIEQPMWENTIFGDCADRLYTGLCEEVYKHLLESPGISDPEVRKIIAYMISSGKEFAALDFSQRRLLEQRVFNHFRRLDILQPLLEDETITEIMVNGPSEIFYEKAGKIYVSPLRFHDEKELLNIIVGYFAKYNKTLSQSQPISSLRLSDGSRAHAIIPPVVLHSPVLTIRKFSGVTPDLASLIHSQFLSPELADYLTEKVKLKKAIMIGGGTGCGKTTLLNVLSAYIPKNERIITIEDAPELQLQNRKNWVRLCTRDADPDGFGEINSSALIRNALRMRPDRIIIGEVRGGEAYDMMQATMTGHPGTLCTVHGNDCESMFLRTADLILTNSKLRYDVILRQLASAFDVLIHISRTGTGQRKIQEVCELYPDKESVFKMKTIFQRRHND